MLIDVNAWLGRWPFQRFAMDSAAALDRHLRAEGIDAALVSPVEALLRPDPGEDNAALFRAVAASPSLRPVPVLNPSLPGWAERLHAHAGRGAWAVRVAPNYHLYDLDAPGLGALAGSLVDMGLPLLIQVRVEDERNQYPPLRIAGVPVAGILALARRHPQLRIACLCPYLGEAVELANGADNVCVDLSFAETLDTVGTLLTKIPAERLLFGSHTPFLYTRAARLKLDCASVSPETVRALSHTNAERLLGAERPAAGRD